MSADGPRHEEIVRGTDGTIGFVYAWDSNNNARKGKQEIKSIIDGQRIDVEVRFEKPMKSVGTAPIITEAVNKN